MNRCQATVLNRRAVLGGALALGLAGRVPAQQPPASNRAKQLVAAARAQIGVTLRYDPAYSVLAFPHGDVERGKGVCTDVVIRAFRDALGLDLQALLHADMRAHFSAYSNIWGLRHPDRNIDHRRVPNLMTFWSRQGARLPVTNHVADWRAGDIFTSLVGGRLPHTGIVSDRKTEWGEPLVIHNIGAGTQEEAVLFEHRLTGHFRWQV
ncbi:MAG: DUF1287 domain-containing protein [Burkholderiaceae bacterium]|jgi:uncharacterized protein YijF (DUF1287 family)|nr:DUF1287 domain-containing protein [Burkholderiaceae bacterium]